MTIKIRPSTRFTWFQKNLVVWKLVHEYLIVLSLPIVSEELSSVETDFPVIFICALHCFVSEELSSVETELLVQYFGSVSSSVKIHLQRI